MNAVDNLKSRMDRWTLTARYGPHAITTTDPTAPEPIIDAVFSTRRDARAAADLVQQLRPDLITGIVKRGRS